MAMRTPEEFDQIKESERCKETIEEDRDRTEEVSVKEIDSKDKPDLIDNLIC